MGPRRKAKHKGLGKHRHLKRGIRDLKNRGKDIDQIFESLYRDDNLDTDTTELKGQGMFYCKYCDRYFIDSNALTGHEATKFHKRRLKALSAHEEHVP
ncbi:BUD20, bud site selection protein 20 [Babesia microti strain RI]|uniref:BUD20, bud site selection protein 20 n=1 Tax=Babesia microti (strain RI) TaxID=1133968 RepID=A0A1R4AAU4_BABMR|nr:BUD20, bud site selection protein 20 [Babesia microti strain RI]SJK86123.1 BUD20, bud site selection protein 20 [Babesia microti strain RI]|eukprot:XP_021338317.1 BUD20, bud site selection protein 20 [Babesia microti strain RI]